MGRGAVRHRASERRGILVSPRLGLRAPGAGLLLWPDDWRAPPRPYAETSRRQVNGSVPGDANPRLALVRGRACIRQCATPPSADPNGRGDQHAIVRRCRRPIATLAYVASDDVIRTLQAGRHQELRRDPPEARSV